MFRRQTNANRRGQGWVPQSWSPAKLSANGLLWLRGDDAPNPVSSWADRYGNFTLVQGTGTRQPSTGTGPNSKPIVSHDGVTTTGDCVVGGETFGNLDAYTACLTFRIRTSYTNYEGVFGIDATPSNLSGNENFGIYLTTTNLAIGHNRGTSVVQDSGTFASRGVPAADTYFTLTISWRVGWTPDIYSNGTKKVTGTTNAAWVQLATSGCYPITGLGFDTPLGFGKLDLAELVMTNDYRTEAQLANLHSYKQRRYALWLSYQHDFVGSLF